MSFRLKRMWRNWEAIQSVSSDAESSTFAQKWVGDLEDTLYRFRNDREFVGHLLQSASDFFDQNMSDKQKHDCFFYLLGSKNRKKS